MQMMRRDFGGKVKNLRRRGKMDGEMRGNFGKIGKIDQVELMCR